MADMKEKGLTLLSATTVSLAAAADTTLYTVPTGKRCILHSAIVVAGTDAGASVISIGADGSETDFISSYSLANLNAQYDSCIITPLTTTAPATLKAYAAGTVIQADITTTAGGATNTIFLYGCLY